MGEPEEESDEEWLRIADAIGVFEEKYRASRSAPVSTPSAAPHAPPHEARAAGDKHAQGFVDAHTARGGGTESGLHVTRHVDPAGSTGAAPHADAPLHRGHGDAHGAEASGTFAAPQTRGSEEMQQAALRNHANKIAQLQKELSVRPSCAAYAGMQTKATMLEDELRHARARIRGMEQRLAFAQHEAKNVRAGMGHVMGGMERRKGFVMGCVKGFEMEVVPSQKSGGATGKVGTGECGEGEGGGGRTGVKGKGGRKGLSGGVEDGEVVGTQMGKGRATDVVEMTQHTGYVSCSSGIISMKLLSR